MSVVESIESGVIPAEIREALRVLLSQHDQPYLDIPGSDGRPGVCISACFADVRRHIEASRPKVPAHSTINGRRQLPDHRPYQDAGTQTEPVATQPKLWSEPAQVESAPEASHRRQRKGGRTRAICSSSSDTDQVAHPASRRPASVPMASSPCAYERAFRKPRSPIYGPEDLICGWVTKKRKLRVTEPRPAKRPATGAGSRPDFSDADDEENANANPKAQETPVRPSLTAAPCSELSSLDTTLARNIATEPIVISSIEGVNEDAPELATIPVGVSSRGSSSDGQKRASAALHSIESATGICVSQRHRGPMIEHSLALGKRDTLENFRQACSYWRRGHMLQTSQHLALQEPRSALLHPALNRFSRAYHTAQTTATHRAVLDVVYRTDLAYLHDVYLQTLKALSYLVPQETERIGSRPRDVFDDAIRSGAKDQMYWACYPEQQGKPRSDNKGLARKFGVTLGHAEKWYDLREKFGVGMLALVPRGANSWFERLPIEDLPVYFRLIADVNPVAVDMAETIGSRVTSLWRREAPPERLLRLELLQTVDEISLELFEEVGVGCSSHHEAGGTRIGRAVTMPAGVDESAAALDTVFS